MYINLAILVIVLLIFALYLKDQLHRFRHDITSQVNTSTAENFADISKRLALIDDAQRRINDLSNNMLNLQQILSDKRSRGAFGEVQLSNLIQNMIPTKNFAFQYQLNNGLRADCMLFLPKPTGNIAIDAKFPLENYQQYNNPDTPESDKTRFIAAFKQDIKKHINDISTKYIVPNETADGAIMFIPAESVFAEIHAKHPDLVTYAHHKRVWLTSPTTMMAVLTTVSSVLKDDATKEHVNYIQEHLRMLAADFSRFDERMQKLAKHINSANSDVQQVQTSAKKISKRFEEIERVQLEEK